MKKVLLLLAALFATVLPEAAPAQVVSQQPLFINNGFANDFGNGPLELKVVLGSAQLFTAYGTGTGTATTTALTLTATPAVPPIIGGFITCVAPTNCSIPANTTVTAFNGTTGVTLSATATITAAAVNWGAACTIVPNANNPPILAQAGVGGDLPFYTQGRICGSSSYSSGAQVLAFPIGAH